MTKTYRFKILLEVSVGTLASLHQSDQCVSLCWFLLSSFSLCNVQSVHSSLWCHPRGDHRTKALQEEQHCLNIKSCCFVRCNHSFVLNLWMSAFSEYQSNLENICLALDSQPCKSHILSELPVCHSFRRLY